MLCKITNRMSPISVLALLAVLGGCVSSQGISSHAHSLDASALAVDQSIRGANVDAHWPTSQWWHGYHDSQLNDLIDKALRDSPSLSIAISRLREAQAMAGITRSSERPQINNSTELRHREWPADNYYGPGTLSNTSTFDNNATLNLSYSLDFWGRERNASERDLDLAQQSAAQVRIAQLELQGNIVRTYVKFSFQFSQRDIALAMLIQQQKIMDLAQRRLRGGLGTDLEVSEAQISLPETRRQIHVLDEQIALSRNQLAALTGSGPGYGEHLQRPSLTLNARMTLPSNLPAQLLGQRPDVVASRWRVAAQTRGIDVARAEFYPNINLAANFGFMAVGGRGIEFLAMNKLGGTVGPALSLPIFDGGRLLSQLGVVTADYDAAVAQYNQTLIEALRDISGQLIRRASADEQQLLAAESTLKAQTTFDLAVVAYKRGLTDYLNVLNAQTQLFRQQQVEQQVQSARLTAYASLMVALGGGLESKKNAPQDPAIQPPPPALSELDLETKR